MYETLGHGSYGKVKKCMNIQEGTEYAAKIVKKSILKRKRIGRCVCVLMHVPRCVPRRWL